MNAIVRNTVEIIGQKVISGHDRLEDVESFGKHVMSWHTFNHNGNKVQSTIAWQEDGTLMWVEVLITSAHNLELLESAVNKYVEDNLNDSLFQSIEEKLNEPYDEWDEHGFRDEADYLGWRYGG